MKSKLSKLKIPKSVTPQSSDTDIHTPYEYDLPDYNSDSLNHEKKEVIKQLQSLNSKEFDNIQKSLKRFRSNTVNFDETKQRDSSPELMIMSGSSSSDDNAQQPTPRMPLARTKQNTVSLVSKRAHKVISYIPSRQGVQQKILDTTFFFKKIDLFVHTIEFYHQPTTKTASIVAIDLIVMYTIPTGISSTLFFVNAALSYYMLSKEYLKEHGEDTAHKHIMVTSPLYMVIPKMLHYSLPESHSIIITYQLLVGVYTGYTTGKKIHNLAKNTWGVHEDAYHDNSIYQLHSYQAWVNVCDWWALYFQDNSPESNYFASLSKLYQNEASYYQQKVNENFDKDTMYYKAFKEQQYKNLYGFIRGEKIFKCIEPKINEALKDLHNKARVLPSVQQLEDDILDYDCYIKFKRVPEDIRLDKLYKAFDQSLEDSFF